MRIDQPVQRQLVRYEGGVYLFKEYTQFLRDIRTDRAYVSSLMSNLVSAA